MFTIDLNRSQRTYTKEGYLNVPGILARTGIQDYRAFELGIKDGDPMRVIRVYRPESEVFDEQAIASFEGVPVTVNHPPEGVTADNWKQYAVGVVKNIARDGNFIRGDITIFDKAAIKAIEDGKDELSNGYECSYSFAPGVTPDGQQYDAIQRNIRGNHLSIVDAARCGSACRVSDSLTPSGVNTMPAEKRKITVDGLPFEVEDSAAVLVEKLVKDRDSAVADATKVKTDLATITATIVAIGDSNISTVEGLVKALKDAQVQVVEMKKDIMTPDARDAMVEVWTKTLADAKRLTPEVTTSGKTCAAIRREVVGKMITGDYKPAIEAVLSGAAVDAASDDQIKTAFSVLAATAATGSGDVNQTDAVAKALTGDGGQSSKVADQPSGRDAYLARNAAAWQPKAA